MSKSRKTKIDPIDVKPPANIVGSTIKRLRRERGLSQEALSDRLELYAVYICRGSISRIEEKLRKVTDRELYAFSKVFGVPMEELIDKDD